eukprot:c4591_g1_i2.p1 GENE.c4591_g1_i2~~c4591_g1_i2.p1  ORF type:complete len:135 (+),score=22.55 c4591_g1_i2:414-818(+)
MPPLPAAPLTLAQVVTFDERGVSAHPNHSATHFGVKAFAQAHPTVLAAFLESLPLALKYLGPFGGLLLGPLLGRLAHHRACVWDLFAIRFAHKGMVAHASQYVWFRRLFVLFSTYPSFNSVRIWTRNRDKKPHK